MYEANNSSNRTAVRQPALWKIASQAHTNDNWYYSPSGKIFRSKWVNNTFDVPTEREVKIIIALLVKYMIKSVFKGHVYYHNGKIYIQTEGGPIGLELSGSVARLILI